VSRTVLVIGGGVIGLATSYRLAQQGLSVQIVDASGSRGASWAAAGMLAPVSEAIYGEEDLTRLNVSAVGEFVRLATELTSVTGLDVGLRHEGTLAVAFNSDDRAALVRLTEFRTSCGLISKELNSSALRTLEPYLASEVRSGVLAVDDLSVDNRRYLAALARATELAGVSVHRSRVREITATGVRTDDGDLAADLIVLCAGALSGELADLPIQPVKGQILRLHVPDRLNQSGPVLSHTVRAIVRGGEIYLVPRADGEVVLGATSEQQGFDTTVTAGGVYELLRNAYEVLPISSEFEFVEARAGSRPGTPDNAPILGRLSERVIVASGHYRNGVLLSATTAEAVAALVSEQSLAEEWRPFGPDRFHGRPIPAAQGRT